jgi:hypothetical protein
MLFALGQLEPLPDLGKPFESFQFLGKQEPLGLSPHALAF